LALHHCGVTRRVNAMTSLLTMGRDEHNDIVITDKRASRHHARIERRRDKFALVDASANGTYVTFEGEPELLLHREEVLLKGRGHISFGHSYESPEQAVEFVCSELR